MAFSRRQPLEPKPLELNMVVRDMTDLLHRSLGEQIELEGVLAPRLWSVEADQSQLESAIINLAVNARDAMPGGGKLTIETSNTMLDETYAAIDAEVVPGQYVVISVSEQALACPRKLCRGFSNHSLRPKRSVAALDLDSAWSTVSLNNPAGTSRSTARKIRHHGEALLSAVKGDVCTGETEQLLQFPKSSAGEVVLLVEDNEDVRAYSAMILNELGYGVLEAADADAALVLIRSEQRIDMLFTDVVLPGRSGRVLADAALQLRPQLKILFTTGYSRNAIVHHGRLDAGVQLITKPFTFEQLAARVRDILDKG